MLFYTTVVQKCLLAAHVAALLVRSVGGDWCCFLIACCFALPFVALFARNKYTRRCLFHEVVVNPPHELLLAELQVLTLCVVEHDFAGFVDGLEAEEIVLVPLGLVHLRSQKVSDTYS